MLGMKNIRGLKAGKGSQTWFQPRFPGYNRVRLLCALVSPRNDCREEEDYLLIQVGRGNRERRTGRMIC